MPGLVGLQQSPGVANLLTTQIWTEGSFISAPWRSQIWEGAWQSLFHYILTL